MSNYLTTLTGYNTRYYKSTTGQQAAAWIQSTMKSIASGRSDITVTAFAHSWVQTSTIVRFAGTSTTSPVTILGAHMDSINLSNPTSGRAPGADDDGTGTVNLMEIFRVLVSSGFKPSTPLEFQFYSGEESGLLGSQAIAQSYSSKGIKVKAMMQLDMTGYFKPGSTEVIALEADYIDSQCIFLSARSTHSDMVTFRWSQHLCEAARGGILEAPGHHGHPLRLRLLGPRLFLQVQLPDDNALRGCHRQR
jgi:leucyl aminopeptidase